MRLSQRQRMILNAVRSTGYIEVKELATRLDVDVSTIRRDLQRLVSDDLVTRLHGGVRPRLAADDGAEIAPLRDDLGRQSIAAYARRMLQPGQSVVLSSGECTDALVSLLFDLDDLTVITHDLRAADTLSRHRHIRVLVAGGELRDAPAAAVTSGPETAAFLGSLHADWVFLEVEGVHPFAGLTTSAPWRVSAMRAMLSAADRRCILATSQVFGRRCIGFVADLESTDLLITDEGLGDDRLPDYAGKVVRATPDPMA